MATELHCNLVAMSPLELQLRAFFTIFIVNQFPEALSSMRADSVWPVPKLSSLLISIKKLHLAFCNIKKKIVITFM